MMNDKAAAVVSEEVVRQALFYCPHELPTPAKHRWIANKINREVQAALGVGGCTWTPQRLFVFQHPLEPDEKVERQRQYALGWNACIDAIEKGIAPPPASEEG